MGGFGRWTEDDLERMSPGIRRQVEGALAEPQRPPGRPAAGPTGGTGRRGRPEQEAGKRLTDWMDELLLPGGLRPGRYFAHIPNGGARTAIEAAILKGQGVRPGWPDYHLALPVGRYHGAFLELKADDAGKPDAEQLEQLVRLEQQGHFVRVAWGFYEAQKALIEYMTPLWRAAQTSLQPGT